MKHKKNLSIIPTIPYLRKMVCTQERAHFHNDAVSGDEFVSLTRKGITFSAILIR